MIFLLGFLRAKGVHIRQAMSGHGIAVMYHSYSYGKQKAAFLALQVHNYIPQSNLTALPIYKAELTP